MFFLILYYLHADIDITAFVKKSLSEADDLTSLTPDMRENNRKAAAVAATLAILKTTSANNDVKDEIPPPRESQRYPPSLKYFTCCLSYLICFREL